MTESDTHTERLAGGQNPSVEARRQRANQIFLANDVRFRALWEITPDAMVLSDPDGIVLDANPAYFQLYGYAPEQVIGHSFAIIFPFSERSQAVEQYKTVFAQPDPPPYFETVVQRADGTQRVVETRINFIEQAGQRTAMLSVIRDITTHKRQEEHLRLLESVVEHITDGVLVTEAAPLNPPGPRIVYVNQALSVLTGYAKEEVIGQTPYLFQGPKIDRQALEQVRQALEHCRPITVELINYTKAGQEFWIELAMAPVVNDAGETTHFVAIQRDITKRKNAEEKLQQQIDFEEALARCSQTLLTANQDESDNRRVLAEALQHLVKPARASKVYLYENFDDAELGFCSRFIIDACAPGIPSLFEDSDPDPHSLVIPWSIAPDENRRCLAAGEPVGGPVKTLFASTPPFRDYLLNEVKVLSVQFVPIHFGDHWWGYVGFDDREQEREWGEEEILLLGTAAEILSSTLQRWQAEDSVQMANERLEQQVKTRTAELSDTIDLLRQEIQEREQAETELQRVLTSLEQRVAARTQELSTFFDLTVLTGRAASPDDVFQQAVPRMLEVTRSRVICIHLLVDDRAGLHLAAQQNLPNEDRSRLQMVELSPNFQRWLQQPHDPLVTTTLPSLDILPPAFQLAGHQTYLGAQIRVSDEVKGLLSCYRFTERGFGLDEISLVVALAEQLGMVLETHRLRHTAAEVAVLEERQRLARELHDSVTQSMYSLTLFARSGREAAEDGDATRLTTSLTEIEDSALHALQEMRLLLYELRAPLLEQEGLVQALDTRLNLVERRVGLQVVYEVDPALPKLPRSLELEMYRLTIEALNNIIKHATARAVTINLQARNGRVQLEINDDGRGFDPRQPTGGLGLTGMRERVDRLEGTLDIVSAPGQGTKILIEVDLADERFDQDFSSG